MNQSQLVSLGIGAGILYAAYKFGPAPVKAMALGVAGVALARFVPGLNALVPSNAA